LINAGFFGQGLSAFELVGATFGISAALVITLWDTCAAAYSNKKMHKLQDQKLLGSLDGQEQDQKTNTTAASKE